MLRHAFTFKSLPYPICSRRSSLGRLLNAALFLVLFPSKGDFAAEQDALTREVERLFDGTREQAAVLLQLAYADLLPVVGVKLGWLPTGGFVAPSVDLSGWLRSITLQQWRWLSPNSALSPA